MENSFYYFGFAYILFQVMGLMAMSKSEKSDKEFMEKMSDSVPGKMSEINTKSFQKTAGHVKDFGLKKIIGIMGSIFCFVWIICGYLYSNESFVFLYILFLLLAIFVLPLFQVTFILIKKKIVNLPDVMKTLKEVMEFKINKAISASESILKIMAATYILYHHFIIL